MLVILVLLAAFSVAAVWFTYTGRRHFRDDRDMMFSITVLGAAVSSVGAAVAFIEVLGRITNQW